MWPARCRHGLKQTPIARIGLALVMVAAALVGATTAARAAPLEGRWVANGHGVRINFVVTRAHGRLIAAHPVAFCGSYGEPVDDEDFRPENLGQLGHQFVADSAPIRRGGRFGDMGTSEGVRTPACTERQDQLEDQVLARCAARARRRQLSAACLPPSPCARGGTSTDPGRLGEISAAPGQADDSNLERRADEPEANPQPTRATSVNTGTAQAR
jgi:hypothetical protein